MYTRQQKPFCCSRISTGADRLAELAERTYAHSGKIQYKDHAGIYQTADGFGELLQNAEFEDADMARAAAALCTLKIPTDGCKTAMILLAPLLRAEQKNELTRKDARMLFAFCESYLERIAMENDGRMPGAGLTFMSLIRPIRKYAREHGCEQAGERLCDALLRPMFATSQAAGVPYYEAYERIKALAPNQFLSLNQVGIVRSINTNPLHTDVLRMGIDIKDAKIKDLFEAGICESVEVVQEVIAFTAQAFEMYLNITESV